VRGQRAVLDIIHHRVVQSRTSVCAVVTAKGQFSWYKGQPMLPYTDNMRAMMVRVVSHKKVLKSENFRHFYSGSTPHWAKSMDCRKIANHNFCKLKRKTISGQDRR